LFVIPGLAPVPRMREPGIGFAAGRANAGHRFRIAAARRPE
jgi:hypothetical protein